MSTDDKKKLTHEEALAAMIDDFTMEHHAEQAKAMTKEELLADLAEQGLPKERLDAIFAKQDEMIKKAREADAKKPPEAPPKMADVIPFRRQLPAAFAGMGIAAALALAVGASLLGAGTIAFVDKSKPVDTATGAGTGGTGTGNRDQADALRENAYKECGKAHWESCLHLLDQAKKLDPHGDKEDDAMAARTMAERALTPTNDGGK